MLAYLPEPGKETSVKWTQLDTQPGSGNKPEISWRIIPMTVPAEQVNKKYGQLDFFLSL